MEQVIRKTVIDELTKYDYLSKKDQVVEVTLWSNGEGFDIYFSDKEETISLSNGKIEAIYFLSRYLNYNSEDNGTEEI